MAVAQISWTWKIAMIVLYQQVTEGQGNESVSWRFIGWSNEDVSVKAGTVFSRVGSSA